MSKESKQKILEEFLEKAKAEDIDEIVVFGINSVNRDKCMSVMRAENAHSATAMVGMLIKLLADDIEIPSYELAHKIGEKLKETEEQVEKIIKEKEKKEKKTLHIKITTDDE